MTAPAFPGFYYPPSGVQFMNPSRAAIGGLDFGVIEPNGTAWVVNDIQGWGSPASTVQVTQKPRSFGGWAGVGYLPARTLSLTGTVDAPDTATLSDAVDRLNAACSLTDTPLTVIEGDRPRSMYVRRQGEVLVSWTSSTAATWSIQVVALDPRKYGVPITATTTLPSSEDGLSWPVSWPIAWTGVTNTGVISIPNLGNATAPVKLRINGPVIGPIVTHLGSQTSLVFSTSLALATGEFLTVDMEKREVLAQGQASRNGYVLSRGWFGADPGANEYAFQAQVANTTAQLSVTVPSGAWL